MFRRCCWTRHPIRRRGWAGIPGSPAPAGGVTTRDDAADAVFEAEVIEAQQVDWRKSEEAA